MPLPAAQRSEIEPFYVMEVMRAAEERELAGVDILHLEIGQPSTGAPRGVVEAAQAALVSGDPLGYTSALGTPELRGAISQHYADTYGLEVPPECIVVTAGASASCVLAFLACFDQGDRVAVASPGYPCYRNMLATFGAEPVDVEVDAGMRYQLAPELLEEAMPLGGVVAASPSNPTGTILDAPALSRLAQWCRANDVRLISDEIYHGITYEIDAPTALAATPDAVVINSFSKYFSMTGWRLGWLVIPDNLLGAVERLTQNLYISAPTFSQVAAVRAFDCHAELTENVDRYAQNRRVLLDGLPRAGIDECAPVDGAFYLWARVGHLCDDSKALCAEWLSELQIAATPGIDFDPVRGREYVRFSFAGSTADMEEAMRRLERWHEARG
ncbi:MAG: pyridoxal phosphate-dependent aminotransferase [Actinomycetia bacterium]|nr:pyridoxal phosphate-dependent aminotransferase [Actinomycetes bacterium]